MRIPALMTFNFDDDYIDPSYLAILKRFIRIQKYQNIGYATGFV